MDLNDVRSAVTLASLLLFTGLVGWVWWPNRRHGFEQAAQLPFAEEGDAQ